MVTFYCPGCWHSFEQDISPCPQCGLRIHEFWDSKDRVEKLMMALHHPEPETVYRCAWLLGESKDVRAVKPLMQLIQDTDDVYAALAAVKALGEIGNAEAREFLRTLAAHPAQMIREESQKILGRFEEPQGKP
jgi:HEAT repeat protein